MTIVTVPVTMAPDDLRRLVMYSSPWTRRSLATAGPEHLFETLDGTPPRPDPRWTRAYWVGPHWATIVLARAYLAALGHDVEILWDDATDPATGWVILTTHNPDPTQATARARTIQPIPTPRSTPGQ